MTNHGKFNVGDLVHRTEGFRSGCGFDVVGVVIQSNPLIFTTENGTMRWSASVDEAPLTKIGEADEDQLSTAIRRLRK